MQFFQQQSRVNISYTCPILTMRIERSGDVRCTRILISAVTVVDASFLFFFFLLFFLNSNEILKQTTTTTKKKEIKTPWCFYFCRVKISCLFRQIVLEGCSLIKTVQCFWSCHSVLSWAYLYIWFSGSTVMSTVIEVCNKYCWARASSVSWLQFYVMPPGYCKVIGIWNILRPITRVFPRSIPINHPACSINGKMPTFGARNTNLCEVSMCKDSCSLERCAGVCLSVREQFQNWGFAPTLSLLMWQQIWGQKAFTGSPLGAKAVRKKN